MSNKNLSLTEKNQTNAKQSHYEVILDNETTCITFHHIKPGECTGWHRHEKNYAAFHIQAGELIHEDANGAKGFIKSESGKANFYDVGQGFEHNAINVGKEDIIALEIEYK